jgi:hypothetical protein
MLKSKRMPQEFWAEALACAVYLRNRSPTISIWNITPQKAWSGHKPNISHLRVFGSMAYMHVPEQKRTKLDDRSEKLIFIGYDSSSKGYKLYNPTNGKIVVTRDGIFEEDKTWDWNVKEEEKHEFLPIHNESSRRTQGSTDDETPQPPTQES